MLVEKYKMLKDIEHYSNWKTIKHIDKGWSDDKKFYIEDIKGSRFFLRVASISKYSRKKEEFEMISKMFKSNINMSKPMDFGVCNSRKNCYTLFSWIDGEDAETKIQLFSREKQFLIGYETGKMVKKIHLTESIERDLTWSEKYNKKINRIINDYKNCSIKIPNSKNILKYIEDNRHLLDSRLETIQHGDFHIGNMVIDDDEKIGIIDFNRCDYGDPWEEFNRLPFSVNASLDFARGQVDGYFNGKIPDEFFKLTALYIGVNILSSVPWAIKYGKAEVDFMMNSAKEMLTYYDDFKRYIPSWYEV